LTADANSIELDGWIAPPGWLAVDTWVQRDNAAHAGDILLTIRTRTNQGEITYCLPASVAESLYQSLHVVLRSEVHKPPDRSQEPYSPASRGQGDQAVPAPVVELGTATGAGLPQELAERLNALWENRKCLKPSRCPSCGSERLLPPSGLGKDRVWRCMDDGETWRPW
jgi:hypothetical protein